MVDVVNDIIATKPFDAGTMVIEKTALDVGVLLREIMDVYNPIGGKKGLVLVSRIDEGLPDIKIDRVLIFRAMSNLMQNAINYTPEGGMISISAETLYNKMLAIQVSDSGNGIPREEHDKIFRKYYRASAVKGIKGNGVGLTIVKEVACAHGGCVELESIEGVGSTFTLYLPV